MAELPLGKRDFIIFGSSNNHDKQVACWGSLEREDFGVGE
jgi:hypothetical protein